MGSLGQFARGYSLEESTGRAPLDMEIYGTRRETWQYFPVDTIVSTKSICIRVFFFFFFRTSTLFYPEISSVSPVNFAPCTVPYFGGREKKKPVTRPRNSISRLPRPSGLCHSAHCYREAAEQTQNDTAMGSIPAPSSRVRMMKNR